MVKFYFIKGCCNILGNSSEELLYTKLKTNKINYNPFDFSNIINKDTDFTTNESNNGKGSIIIYKNEENDDNINIIDYNENTEFKNQFKGSILLSSIAIESKQSSNTNILEFSTYYKEEELKNSKNNVPISQDYPTLELHVKDAINIEPSLKIVITPFSSNNKPNTSYSSFIFGKNLTTNTFNFPEKENVNQKQFEIIYDSAKKLYSVKDLPEGTGLFLNLRKKLKIDYNYMLSFCETHLYVQYTSNCNELKLKFLKGAFKEKKYIFNPSNKNIIKIGRHSSNEIVYKDGSVSRIQCIFKYETDGFWYVYDGDGEQPSRNGLWILASVYFTIEDGMNIKTGNTTFEANIINGN